VTKEKGTLGDFACVCLKLIFPKHLLHLLHGQVSSPLNTIVKSTLLFDVVESNPYPIGLFQSH